MTNRSNREINGHNYTLQPTAGPLFPKKSFITIELQALTQITGM